MEKPVWKRNKNPSVNFCPVVPTMQVIDSYLARSKYHVTIENLVCPHFYGAPDAECLAA